MPLATYPVHRNFACQSDEACIQSLFYCWQCQMTCDGTYINSEWHGRDIYEATHNYASCYVRIVKRIFIILFQNTHSKDSLYPPFTIPMLYAILC